MTLVLLLMACKTKGNDDVIVVPTADTDDQREIPAVTADRLSVRGHAEECQQVLGPIPGFDCLDDTVPVPVTDGAATVTGIQDTCDKPSLLEG